MLQIKDICKQYKTGGFVQQALDHVSLNLRENEFVAILGPSGSGKTTLLNIIGGLDRYDSGDLIINGISTKKYKSRDWDSYRNHTIGFVFQSYNLIPHQTVLANVELALTISGVSKKERRLRAVKALEEVGLGQQLHKRPNQMSGGQMQRVAIARALVNNPDILLADEPTGALDSDTSVQVMELLARVAKDRLVVMVTHNPELAEKYATRIVNLKDGVIRSDTDPYIIEETSRAKPVHKNMGKSSMSLLTSLSLSFNNLRTKKARTLLTSFAGSIGIIGIALILSVSNGVSAYIQSIEEDTLSEYPVQIQSVGMDTSSLLFGMGGSSGTESGSDTDEVRVSQVITGMLSKVESNDLTSLKSWLDSGESGIESYANAIEYVYSVSPQIYRLDGEGVRQVHPDSSFSSLGISSSSSSSLFSSMMSTDVFSEMPENASLYENQYDVKAGRWPKEYNECVLVLTSDGSMSDFLLYTLGLRDSAELDAMVKEFAEEKDVTAPADIRSYSYDEILGTSFRLVNAADYYEYDEEYRVWKDKTDNDAYMRKLVENGEELTIVGIVQPSERDSASMLEAGIGYLPSLTAHVVEQAAESQIVKEQLANKDTDVFTGEAFDGEEEDDKESFDMSSLFQINADAMKEAFQMDESSLELDLTGLSDLSGMDLNLDLSGLGGSLDLGDSLSDFSKYLDMEDMAEKLQSMIDPEKLKESLPQMPEIDLAELAKEIEVHVTAQDVEQLLGDLLEGYQKSVAGQADADIEQLAKGLQDYYTSTETIARILEKVNGLLKENISFEIPYEQLLETASQLIADYQQYVKENKIKDAGAADVLNYLASAEVQQKVGSEVETLLKEHVTVGLTMEQLLSVMQEIADGYPEYAAANGYPLPEDVGNYFLQYMQSEEGQKILYSGLSSMVDTSGLEQKFSETMGSYMTQAMTAYTETLMAGVQSGMEDMMDQMGEEVSKALESAMKEAMSSISGSMQGAMEQVMNQVTAGLTAAVQQAMTQLGSSMGDALTIDPEAFADAIEMNMSEEELSELMTSLMTSESASYDGNLKKLGYADQEKPGEIDIYPKDFESKNEILEILDAYNADCEARGEEEKAVTYTDMVGTLMSSVTKIVNTVSYVLVAFVAISLVVSSIMIGVITYISVLERRKEIGILRAIGASKHNISQVFNAETFIIGLCAGLMGIGITLVALIPGNVIIHRVAESQKINAALPPLAAVVLIALSVGLTLLGGLIPSRKAAKSDPVTALRSE